MKLKLKVGAKKASVSLLRKMVKDELGGCVAEEIADIVLGSIKDHLEAYFKMDLSVYTDGKVRLNIRDDSDGEYLKGPSLDAAIAQFCEDDIHHDADGLKWLLLMQAALVRQHKMVTKTIVKVQKILHDPVEQAESLEATARVLEMMNVPTLRTPSNIEVLLHCHVSLEPHPRHHAPAVQEGLQLLERHGLIESRKDIDDAWQTTEKGKLKVEELCQVRL